MSFQLDIYEYIKMNIRILKIIIRLLHYIKAEVPENNINWDLIETFIITNKKSDIPLSTYLIYLEILEHFDNSEIKISKHAINERIYRFLERANYSIRVETYIRQTFPKALNLINIFHKILKEFCVYGINKIIENDLIANIDEAGIFLNSVYNNIINKTGEKNILIKTNGQKKMRIKVILGITPLGSKLPLYIIFKGRQNAIIQKKLEKLDLVVNKKAFIAYNHNACSTIYVMKDYHEKIWQPFVIKHLFSMGL